jgi:O-antigen ligase
MADIAVGMVYAVIAFCSAILLVFAIRALFDFGARYPRWILPAIFWVIVVANIFATLLSGRDLTLLNIPDYLNPTPVAFDAQGGPLYDNVLRVFTFLLLGLPLVQIIHSRFVPRPEPWGGLFWGFLIFFVGNFVLNGVFGSHPAFMMSSAYFAIAVVGVLSVKPRDIPLAIRHVKYSAFFLVSLSLVAAVVYPSLVLETGYRSMIPGLDVRLHGLSSNPNAMGPICLIAILLEVACPHQNRVIRWLIILVSTVALMLTQSKTTWVAGIAALTVSFVALRLPRTIADLQAGLVKATTAIAAVAFVGIGLFLVILLAFGDVSSMLSPVSSSREGAELTTLTGRSAIWRVAMGEWEKNPMFGYGPELWNAEFRSQVGMSFAYSAHNEYIQSLSRAGLIGLIALIVYMGCIGWLAIVKTRNTNGLSLALFVMLVVRGVAETPLSIAILATAEAFNHLLILCVLRWPTEGTGNSVEQRQERELSATC